MSTYTKRIHMNEYNFYKMLKDTDIIPKIIEITFDELIVEKYYSTVGEILSDNSLQDADLEKITLHVTALINTLHSYGIIHGDLHNDNIVCNKELTDFRLIDFEKSTFINIVDDGYIEEYNHDFCTECKNIQDILNHELINFIS